MPSSRPEPVHRDQTSAAPAIGRLLVGGQFLLLAGIAWAGILDRQPGAGVFARVAAAFCVAYAAWTGLGGVRQLGRHLTPSPMPRPGSPLCTAGIYARVRHPLYASTLALSLGWTLWWHSPWAGLLTGALAGWLHFKARFEERWLRRQFPGYDDYAARVPRYVPHLLRR